MKNMMNMMTKVSACMALLFAISTFRVCCWAIVYQPELPKAALKYMK